MTKLNYYNFLKRGFKITLFALVLFSISFCFGFARDLELEYPAIPGEPEIAIPAPGISLAQLFKYIYHLLLGLGFVLAFSFIVYAGLLYLTSFGNPRLMNKAKTIISSALVGLLLLFGSYTVLSTIDPGLVLWGIRILELEPPKIKPVAIEDPEVPPGCHRIPLEESLETINDLQYRAFETMRTIEGIVFKQGYNPDDENHMERVLTGLVKNIHTKSEGCKCSPDCRYPFKAICFNPPGTSPACPAYCPPGMRPWCPDGFWDKDVPGLERKLTQVPQFIGLLEGFGHTLSQELRNDIIDRIEQGLPEREREVVIQGNVFTTIDPGGITGFISFLESELGDFTLEQKRQIRQLLGQSLSVQIGNLERILKELTEVQIEFDKYKKRVAHCRADLTRTAWVCAEAKDKGLLAKCRELDFYCCPL